jgi:hypothetical protein
LPATKEIEQENTNTGIEVAFAALAGSSCGKHGVHGWQQASDAVQGVSTNEASVVARKRYQQVAKCH